MIFKDFGLTFSKAGEVIESVSEPYMTVDLMASFDGTEVISHKLKKDARWGMGPDDGWNALEFIYVIEGELLVTLNNTKMVVKKGDYVKAAPIQKDCLFYATVDTEFLYVTSQPVFHHYSNILHKFKNIADEVEQKDGYTSDHCSRILNLSMLIGENMNLSSKEMHQLNIGSYLHDLGKVKVPDHVLNKPGKLTEQEWTIMKAHPTYGRIMMEETNFPILMEAAAIVEQHHERYNGSGYPYALKKEDILMGSSIVAVVDSYDAMTTDRVYRKGMSKEEALTEIKNCRETLYHPDVVDIFLSLEKEI
ncbi:HD domain-containing phosphohydrolase [Bacillus pinisoli]|uniref:HD domain-containing phosphohydrolase n=1 Tax=Bacillus pinisoli TaxID=2901866 RepID=UPI001FF6F159|nr:HD domain-containing phosphohydrolase [Bacillus pinisoli]